MDNGGDTDGHAYKNVNEMWRKELSGGRDSWYAKAAHHWETQEPNLNGILGGFPETNGPDLRESKRFIELIKQKPLPPTFDRVLDCGAGIGRVTSGLLLDVFQTVDLVEPCKQLLETAKREITDPRAKQFFCCALQDVHPDFGSYDVIWAQWVLLYLPDDDLIKFLEHCQKMLTSTGMIFVKENVVLDGKWIVDKEDNSISRTDAQYKSIFKRAGLTVLHEMQQTHWPPDLIPVKMYALRSNSAVAQ